MGLPAYVIDEILLERLFDIFSKNGISVYKEPFPSRPVKGWKVPEYKLICSGPKKGKAVLDFARAEVCPEVLIVVIYPERGGLCRKIGVVLEEEGAKKLSEVIREKNRTLSNHD